MAGFFIRRILQLLVVLWAIGTFLFFGMRLTGDPISIMFEAGAPEEVIEKARDRFGLDDPLYVQYGRFFYNVLPHWENGRVSYLDFGDSFRERIPALKTVLPRLPDTLILGGLSFAVAVLVSIPLGIFTAALRGKTAGWVVLLGALLGQSIPNFWLAIALILVLAVMFPIFPACCFEEGARSLVLPVFTLSLFFIAKFTRILRGDMIEVLREDYIRTARAKGLRERTVLARHAAKNAFIPVVTVMGMDVAVFIGGTVIVERIFAWPGIGFFLVQAASSRDYPVVQAIVFIVTIGVVLANFAVDLLHRWLDPRLT